MYFNYRSTYLFDTNKKLQSLQIKYNNNVRITGLENNGNEIDSYQFSLPSTGQRWGHIIFRYCF